MNLLTAPLSSADLAFRVRCAAAVDHIPAWQVDNGDILTCPDRCCAQLVMGCSTEGSVRLLVVREGETWEQREALIFHPDRLLHVVHPHGQTMLDHDHAAAIVENARRNVVTYRSETLDRKVTVPDDLAA